MANEVAVVNNFNLVTLADLFMILLYLEKFSLILLPRGSMKTGRCSMPEILAVLRQM